MCKTLEEIIQGIQRNRMALWAGQGIDRNRNMTIADSITGHWHALLITPPLLGTLLKTACFMFLLL